MKTFCFVALTSYQLMITDIFLEEIKKIEHNAKIIVILVGIELDYENPEVNVLIKIKDLNKNKLQRLWQRIYYGGNLFFVTNTRRELSRQNNIYLFLYNDKEPISHRILRYCKKRKCCATVIEEGVGMYADSSTLRLTNSEKIRLFVTSLIGSPMQYRSIADSRMIDNCVVSNTEVFSKLNKAKNKRIIGMDIMEIVDRSESFLKHVNCQALDQIGEFEIMYLGQNPSGYGTLIQSEREYMRQIFDLLKGYKILIKPHPSDRIGKYNEFLRYENITILDNRFAKLPIESIYGKLGVRFIVSDNSTAGLNIAGCNSNIKCIYLRHLYGRPFSVIDNRHSIRNQQIYTSNRNNVFFPNTEEEFLDLLCSKGENIDENRRRQYSRSVRDALTRIMC